MNTSGLLVSTERVLPVICAFFVFPSVSAAQSELDAPLQKVTELVELGDPVNLQKARGIVSNVSDETLRIAIKTPWSGERTRINRTKQFLLREVLTREISRSDEWFEVFLSSLGELGMSPLCVVPLSRLEGARGGTVIAKLDGLLRDTQIPLARKRSWLRILGSYESRAQGSQDTVREVLLNTAASERVRAAAARCMLSIAGLEKTLPLLVTLNERQIAITALAVFGLKTNGTFNASPELRSKARAFIHEALRDADLEVRTVAFEAMALAYGQDFVVQEEDGTSIVNPGFQQALKYMAENERDPRLRERAQGVYGTLDLRLQKALRKRAANAP